MVAHRVDAGGETNRNALDRQFASPDEIKKLILRIHPDRFGGESDDKETPGYWSGKLTRLLNALRDTEQSRFWDAETREQIAAGQAPIVRLVRMSPQGETELSPEIVLPPYAHSFLLGVDAYTSGQEWNEVLSLLARDPKIAAEKMIAEFEARFKTVGSLEDARRLLIEFFHTPMADRARDKISGRLRLLFSKLYDREAKACTELRTLARLKSDAISLLLSPEAEPLSFSEITITLDMAALDLAQQMLAQAKTSTELPHRWTEILAFPFSAPEQDLQLLAQCFDEVSEKMFIRDMKRKRTFSGLDALRLEIANYNFRSLPAEERRKKIEAINATIDKFIRVYGTKLAQERGIDKA